MNFVNYASANRRERLNPPERLMIRSERLIAKQEKNQLSEIYTTFFKLDNILHSMEIYIQHSSLHGNNSVAIHDHHAMAIISYVSSCETRTRVHHEITLLKG